MPFAAGATPVPAEHPMLDTYREVVTPQKLVGFALIWLALGVYSAEGVLRSRRARSAAISAAKG